MEQKGLLITFVDKGFLKTEKLYKNIFRKITKPLYIVTNEKSRDCVLYTTFSRESEDSSAKRKHLTCKICGDSIPHRKGQKLSKDCLIEESPDQISKAWSKKIVDWVEEYVQSSLRKPEYARPLDTRMTPHQLKSFCYGISNKLFSVECDCEVRLHLSREEISRLSLNYNFIGFIVSYLASEEYMELLRSFLQGTKEADVLQKICQPAGYFFCSSDRNKRNEHLEHLQKVLENDIKAVCRRLGESTGSLVCGALVALVAAELASHYGNAQNFNEEEEDDQPWPEQPQMNHEKFEKMVKAFDDKTELKVEVRCNKKIYSLYRNRSLNGWGQVGKKLLQSGRIFTFGLCIKNFSITGKKWQVQLFQNYEDTQSMDSSFHFMAFAKHLMMIREWRMKLEILRQDANKREIIQDITELAARFFCDRSGKRDAFRKHFHEAIKKMFRNNPNLPGETECLYVMGVWLVVLGALSALSISQQQEENEQERVDGGVLEDVAHSTQKTVDGDVQEDVAPRALESVDGGVQKDVAPRALESVDGGFQEDVAPSAQESVDGGVQEDVAPRALDRVDGGVQEDVAPRALESVDGGVQQDVAPSAQERVDGGVQDDVTPSAQERVDGGVQDDVTPSAQERVDGGAQEDVVPSLEVFTEFTAKFFYDWSGKNEVFKKQEVIEKKCSNSQNVPGETEDLYAMGVGLVVLGALSALPISPQQEENEQESVDSSEQEEESSSAQESMDDGVPDVCHSVHEGVDVGAQEDVGPSAQKAVADNAQESVDSGEQEALLPTVKEIVDDVGYMAVAHSSQEGLLHSAQGSILGSAQEDMAPSAQENVDGGAQEDMAPSAQENVDGGAQEDMAPSAQENVDGGAQEDMAPSAQENVDGGAQEDMAPSPQENVDGGAQDDVGSRANEGVESDEQDGAHPQTPGGANTNGEYNPAVNKPSPTFEILNRLNLSPYPLLALILLIILLLIIFYVFDISGFDLAIRFRVLTKNHRGNMPPF